MLPFDSHFNERSTDSLEDKRFPSGPWRGVYFEEVAGIIEPRPMRMTLKFWASGHFDGEGTDPQGSFLIRSRPLTRESGTTIFFKQSAGKSVRFCGRSLWPQGGVSGVWDDRRSRNSGAFQVWPGRVMRVRGVEALDDDVAVTDLDAVGFLGDDLAHLPPMMAEWAALAHRGEMVTVTPQEMLKAMGETTPTPKALRRLRLACRAAGISPETRLEEIDLDAEVSLKAVKPQPPKKYLAENASEFSWKK